MVEVALYTGGVVHRGWQSVTITRALDQVAGSFTVGMTERLSSQSVPLKIRPGATVTVKLDRQTVITGYIDAVSVDYTDRDHAISVSGRDKTADLVDCSAPSRHFIGQSLVRIAQALCQPFGITVLSDIEPIIVADVKNEEGETVFELLEKLARANSALLTSTPEGHLRITQGGKGGRAGTLTLGDNIKAASGGYDDRDRYSVYVGKGQLPGTDFNFGVGAAQVTGRSVDPGVTRYRPLLILAEEGLSISQIQTRINWESNVRAARALSFTYTVVGWTNAAGGLWQPNDTVRVIDAFMGLDQELLITQVGFASDGAGLVTQLTLAAPGSFTPEPVPQVVARTKVKPPKAAKTALQPDYFLP